MREAVAQFLQVLVAEDAVFRAIRTPSHGRESYHIRYLFAHQSIA
jgi:hypothetical protein